MREYDKNKILKGFRRIIDERSLESMTRSLYRFFTLRCGFIAHYNIHGFKDYYSGRNFLEFLSHFTNPPFYIYCNNEYGDWFREMSEYAKASEQQILFEFENKELNAKLALLQSLAHELGYEVVSKQSQVEMLNVDENGQFRLTL